MVGIVRRLKNNESIEEWYNTSKSVKENLNFAKENNIKVSRATLFRFCERNNINTKGNNKQQTTQTHNTMEESTQQTPIIELNKTQLTPQQIEETIKNTYQSLEEFENDFEELEQHYKPILQNDRVSNYSTRWLELLQYYQSLKITA